jgi:hypothetical protein
MVWLYPNPLANGFCDATHDIAPPTHPVIVIRLFCDDVAMLHSDELPAHTTLLFKK